MPVGRHRSKRGRLFVGITVAVHEVYDGKLGLNKEHLSLFKYQDDDGVCFQDIEKRAIKTS